MDASDQKAEILIDVDIPDNPPLFRRYFRRQVRRAAITHWLLAVFALVATALAGWILASPTADVSLIGMSVVAIGALLAGILLVGPALTVRAAMRLHRRCEKAPWRFSSTATAWTFQRPAARYSATYADVTEIVETGPMLVFKVRGAPMFQLPLDALDTNQQATIRRLSTPDDHTSQDEAPVFMLTPPVADSAALTTIMLPADRQKVGRMARTVNHYTGAGRLGAYWLVPLGVVAVAIAAFSVFVSDRLTFDPLRVTGHTLAALLPVFLAYGLAIVALRSIQRRVQPQHAPSTVEVTESQIVETTPHSTCVLNLRPPLEVVVSPTDIIFLSNGLFVVIPLRSVDRNQYDAIAKAVTAAGIPVATVSR